VSHMNRKAKIKFDPSQTNEETLMKHLKKRTPYREMSLKEYTYRGDGISKGGINRETAIIEPKSIILHRI